MSTINARLRELYSSHWSNVIEGQKRFNDSKVKPSNAFLVDVDEDRYSEADIRIMFCGQETNGWGKGTVRTDLDYALEVYNKYYTKGGYDIEENKRSFWRGVKFLKNNLVRNRSNENIYFIWNNILKFGKSKGRGVTEKIRRFDHDCFPVFRDEMEILQPDLVVFLTGPNRNGDIRFHFPDAKFERLSDSASVRAIASVKSDLLGRPAIRLYHPGYYKGFNQVKELAGSEMVQLLRRE